MLKLVPENTHVDFTGKHKFAFIFSALLIIASIFAIADRGLNFGIDFAGGILMEIQTEGAADIPQLRSDLGAMELGSVSIQEFGSPNDVLIRLQEQPGGDAGQQAAIEKVRGSLGDHVTYRRVEFVGPQVGKELIRDGTIAVLFSMGGILLYILFRFQLQFGIAAIVALVHDTILTIGLFALLQMEFSLSTVAAVLMIAGYSINDTVVVFDRVRENLRKYKKKPLAEVFNLSINSMLSRTIMTSFTTMLALVALYVFGGEVIQAFVIALIWGIVVGTYSSVFIATPVLLYLKLDRGDGAAKKETS